MCYRKYLLATSACIFCGVLCTSVDAQENSYNYYYNDSNQTSSQNNYQDPRDRDIHQRANRKGDWDYHSNWRYDRKAFYGGETQGEAYVEEHNPYAGGIGMDPDPEILKMEQYYNQMHQNGNGNNNANRTPQR